MPVEGDRLAQILCGRAFSEGHERIGVAVSGGGDSMALLHILAQGAREAGPVLEAASVDHGLRDEAGAEADFVARVCAGLNIAHETLHWRGWDGQGNLQARARAARYALLADWAQRRGLHAVVLAHTRDDVAETFLMRLARKSGLDGLAAMAPRMVRNGTLFLRPGLDIGRARLRGWLTRRGLDWCEDPSNADTRFDRVRMRQALDLLEPLGIGREALAQVAANLSAEQALLQELVDEKAGQFVRMQSGDVLLDGELLYAAPELARRLIARALIRVSGAAYPPRRAALGLLLEDAGLGRAHNLHGCLVTPGDGVLRIAREWNAVRAAIASPGTLWDGRWLVEGPKGAPGEKPVEIRALGEALGDCPDWRASGLPRSSLMASPAVWRAGRLVSAPLAGFSGGYTARLVARQPDFPRARETH